MSKVTVVVLTKNEEKNIAAVVQNAKKVAAEVLIVDSGSTDKTVQLAEENGARVVYRAWDNDFSAQRNFALQHVKTEWVLYLDADERMNDELCCAVEKAMAAKTQKQYSIMRKIHAFGFTYKHGIFKPDEVLRLFPVNKVHWENKVHERPVCDLPKEKMAGYIEHYTYDSWQQWWDKAPFGQRIIMPRESVLRLQHVLRIRLMAFCGLIYCSLGLWMVGVVYIPVCSILFIL